MTTTIKNLPVPAVTGSLESYISSVNQIPVLTVEEERSLADKVRSMLHMLWSCRICDLWSMWPKAIQATGYPWVT